MRITQSKYNHQENLNTSFSVNRRLCHSLLELIYETLVVSIIVCYCLHLHKNNFHIVFVFFFSAISCLCIAELWQRNIIIWRSFHHFFFVSINNTFVTLHCSCRFNILSRFFSSYSRYFINLFVFPFNWNLYLYSCTEPLLYAHAYTKTTSVRLHEEES